MNLEKAKRLSKRCIEISPDEPAYQDTYGWILYKLGEHAEAEKWIKKAVNSSRSNPVILEHYGDVLFHINQKKEAIKYWKKAKSAGGLSEILNKKIKEGVFYE